MPAINQNVEHWAGNTRVLNIGPVTDKVGNFIDLTAPTAIRWWMAKKVTSTGADIFIMKATPASAGSDTGITTTNTSGMWTIHVALDPDDTEDVPSGNWYHECEVIDNAGRVSTVMTGKFKNNNVLIPSDLDVP